MKEDRAPHVTRVTASAPGYECDVCGSTADVRHIAVPELWHNPDTGTWIDLRTWHECYLCDACAQPDGGLMSATSWDGWVAYQLGSHSAHPSRIIIVPGQDRSMKH